MRGKNPDVSAKIFRKKLQTVQNDLDRLYGPTPPTTPVARLTWLGNRHAAQGHILQALTYYAEAAAIEADLPDDLR